MQGATPEAIELTAAKPIEAELRIASAGRRFTNLLLDTVFFYAFAFVLGIVLAVLGLDAILYRTNEFVLGIVLLFLYYVPQESINGRTFAKWITKTRVVSASGGPITLGQAVARTACRFIPFEPFSFLGDGEKPRGWHDSIPKTFVVLVAKA